MPTLLRHGLPPRVPRDIDWTSFYAGYDAFWEGSTKVAMQRSLPWAGEEETKKYKPSSNAQPRYFNIVKGQNGETYHGLIAALISPHVKVTIGTVGTVGAASAAQREFLYYYLPHEQIAKESGSPGSHREECTRLIAQFFTANAKEQEDIHKAFRDYLSDRVLSTASGNPYVEMPYLSKFYINRFLTEMDPDSKASASAKLKLPKASAVTLMALVLVRRGHEAGDRRVMTAENLRAVLDGFVQANGLEATVASKKPPVTVAPEQAKSAFKPSGKAITHVILFGDIGRLEVAQLQSDYKTLTFIHLPSPFFNDPDLKEGAASQAMQTFRGDHAMGTSSLGWASAPAPSTVRGSSASPSSTSMTRPPRPRKSSPGMPTGSTS